MLTQEELKNWLRYNPCTGIFTWRKWNGAPRVIIGNQAGSIDSGGYRRICLNGKQYKVGPLAVLYVTGKWPEAFVDHEDRKRDNNCWFNLKNASRRQNNLNRSHWGRSGFRGVSKRPGRTGVFYYEAAITIKGKRHYLGVFDTAEEASRAFEQRLQDEREE
jgi:hypothetical protein